MRTAKPPYVGSIPAHAGKPVIMSTRRPLGGVYPRPCGETAPGTPPSIDAGGLSPPMRGNPLFSCLILMHRGSIPAHAGKPILILLMRDCAGVYPRPCGETADQFGTPTGQWGLSPPMRGNRLRSDMAVGGDGSIPAHAGKPTALTIQATQHWVYPRPCGETCTAARQISGVWGLSPPMRGNLVWFLFLPAQ